MEFHIDNKGIISEPTRAVQLENGYIIEIKGKGRNYFLEFEDKLLYEVKFKNHYDPFLQPVWERTGEIFTAEQVNALVI